MAISLQEFKETAAPTASTRTPVYNNPDQSTGLEGITSMFKEQEEIIEKQNNSNFTIETTKYLADRQKALDAIGEQVTSGQLTDIQAKEEVSKYDTTQQNTYKTRLPPTYHSQLNELVQTETAKTGQVIDSLYKATVDKEFLVEANNTVERAKELDEVQAATAVNNIISDPRITIDQKVELGVKFKNQYATNMLDRRIQTDRFDIPKLEAALLELEAKHPAEATPEQLAATPLPSLLNLTPEQKTEYRGKILNMIERQKDEDLRKQAAVDRDKETARKATAATVLDYQKQVQTGIAPSAELTATVKAYNPLIVVEGEKALIEANRYRLASTEVRQKMRNDLAQQIQTGSFATDADRDLALARINAMDAMDSEMDKRESQSPVETYLERNPGSKIEGTSAQAKALALSSTNSKIIPYTAKEIAVIRGNWTTPDNKITTLATFVANTKLLPANLRAKAILDQISTVEGNPEKAQELATYALTLEQPLSYVNEDNVVTGINPNTTLGMMLVQGQGVSMNTGGLARELTVNSIYRDQGIDTVLERQMVINAYKYLAKDVQSADTSEYNPATLKRAITMVFGEELKEDSGDSSGGFMTELTSLSYYNQRGRGALRIPTGMTNKRAMSKIQATVNEYARRTNTPLARIKERQLVMVSQNRPHAYMYVDRNNQPLLWGYTTKPPAIGSDGFPVFTATAQGNSNIPVPLIIDLDVEPPK